MNSQMIEEQVRSFVAERSGLVSAAELNSSSSLFSSGLLDSMAFLELVLFAEEKFQIRLGDGGEVTMQALDTVAEVAQAVRNAQARRARS